MPFCAYCVQISTTFLLSSTDALVDALELDVRLDELDRAVGAGGHRLRRGAGEPVDHRAAGDQAEQERRVQDREVRHQLRLQPVGQRHDDREDHRRRADDRGADQHRLGRGLEGVARAVVLLEVAPWPPRSSTSKPKSLLDLVLRCPGSARSSRARRPTARCRSPGRSESTAIVTGPMPRKPNATRPKANTAGAIMPMSAKPERAHAVGDAPSGTMMLMPEPVGAEVAGDEAGQDVQRRAAFFATRSRPRARARDSVEVKTFTSSGMIAPASVPQVMTVESFHHSDGVAARSGSSRYDDDVGQRRPRRSRSARPARVSGASKFICVRVRVLRLGDRLVDEVARRRRRPPSSTRIMKIQTSSWTCIVGSADREQDERDQRDAGDAVGLEAVGRWGRPSRPRCRRCSRR